MRRLGQTIAWYSAIPLPYDTNALQPYLSKDTVYTHYHIHHKGYQETLRDLVGLNRLQYDSLDEVFATTSDLAPPLRHEIVFNAGGVDNHNLYWENLTPDPAPMSARLSEIINTNFTSYSNLVYLLNKAPDTPAGSGWVWIVCGTNNKLQILHTREHISPKLYGYAPLLCIDMWEHSYYLDYRAQKKDYLNNLLAIVDWKVVEDRLCKL